MTPVVSLHLFHDSRTLFLQSASVPPSDAKMEPRYLNLVVHGISSSPSFTASFVFEGGMYSVFCRLTFSPCLSKTSLHLSSWHSALSLVSSQMTKSSAKSIDLADLYLCFLLIHLRWQWRGMGLKPILLETYINLELFSVACQCAHLRLRSFIHVSYHSDVMFLKTSLSKWPPDQISGNTIIGLLKINKDHMQLFSLL